VLDLAVTVWLYALAATTVTLLGVMALQAAWTLLRAVARYRPQRVVAGSPVRVGRAAGTG
jgi:hypothetical protein